MFVTAGAPPGLPLRCQRGDGHDEPLRNAEGWFEHYWAADGTSSLLQPRPGGADAAPSQRHAPRFGKGDLVAVGPSREEGNILRPPVYDEVRGSWYYEVRVAGQTRHHTESDLDGFQPDDDPMEWVVRTPDGHQEIAATLTHSKLTENLTDTFYSFGACRTEFRPYQFRPVIKLLRTDRHRLLIADEVGLGKTIEAGLIWTELEARRLADRVLVICPSMLEHKWIAEMREHFGFELSPLDSKRMGKWLEQAQVGMFPPRERVVCSIERLRLWEGLQDYDDLLPRFDLVIVDEAHWLRNTGTKSHLLGALLSDWADTLLFLSATPLNLGNADLFNLLHLLEPGEFDDKDALEERLRPNAALNVVSESLLRGGVVPTSRVEALDRMKETEFGEITSHRPEYTKLREILKRELGPDDVSEVRRLISELNALAAVLTRTRKTEVNERQALREPRSIHVTLDRSEMTLYRAVYNWQVERSRRLKIPFGFASQMPLRLAGSCLQAMKRRILGTDGDLPDIDSGGAEDWGDWDNSQVQDWDDWDADQTPAAVIKAAKELGDQDTKYDQFAHALREIVNECRQVLVFTFSRHTLAYLRDRLLQDSFSVCELHGDVPKKDRASQIRQFRDGDYDVMVATRVASEGLDFEFCGAIANYDLPWNPMEVEQRIGRIDRIGQTEQKIYVLNCVAHGTIEGDIIHRVHERIGVFNESIGELEPILWNQLLRDELFRMVQKTRSYDFKLTDKEDKLLDEKIKAAKSTNERMATELQDSADFLNVVDVDKFDNEVRDSGRFVGQQELVCLLRNWADSSPEGAWCRTSSDGLWVIFRGDLATADALDRVAKAKERTQKELEDCRSALINEMDIRLCLDQEKARRGGHELLNVNHPLVRAALYGSEGSACRFGSAQITVGGPIKPGRYLVLVAIARWEGVRSSNQLWTTAVGVDGASANAAVASGGEPTGPTVGDALLSALPNGDLLPTSREWDWTEDDVQTCLEQMRAKHDQEKSSYDAENKTLAATRDASYRISYGKKIKSVDRAIATLQARGSLEMIPLQEKRKRHAEHLLAQQLEELDRRSRGTVSYECLTLCDLEVIEP